MEKRYGALRTIATINISVGWVILVVGELLSLGLIGSAGFVAGSSFLIGSVLAGLLLVASGQIIYVIIDIEENTRKAIGRSHAIEPEPPVKKDELISEGPNDKVWDIGKLSESELKDLVNKALIKLEANGYESRGYSSWHNKWKIYSKVDSADLYLDHRELIDFANSL